MASDMIEEMELHREQWEATLLGFDFWKDAFEWCAEVDAREQAERVNALDQLARLQPTPEPVFYSESEYSVRHTSDSDPEEFVTAIDTQYRPEEEASQASREDDQGEVSSPKKSIRRLGSPFQFSPIKRVIRASTSQYRLEEEVANQASREDDQGDASSPKKSIRRLSSPFQFNPIKRAIRASTSAVRSEEEVASQASGEDDQGDASSPKKSIRRLSSPFQFNPIKRAIRASTSAVRSEEEVASQASGEDDQGDASSPKKSIRRLSSPFQFNPIKRAIRASTSAIRSFSASLKGSRSTTTIAPPDASPEAPEGSPAPAITFEDNCPPPDVIIRNPESPTVTYLYFKKPPAPAVSPRGPGRPPPPSRHPFINPLACHPPNGPPNLEPVVPPVQFDRLDHFEPGVPPFERPSCYPRVARVQGSSPVSFEGPEWPPRGVVSSEDSSPVSVNSRDYLPPGANSRRVGPPWERPSPGSIDAPGRSPSRVDAFYEVSPPVSLRGVSPLPSRVVLPSVDRSPLVTYGDPCLVVIPCEEAPPVPPRAPGRPTPPSRHPFVDPLRCHPPNVPPDFEPRLAAGLKGLDGASDDPPTFHHITPPIPIPIPPNAPRLEFATLHREPGLIMVAPPKTPERRPRVSPLSPPSAATQITEAFTHASSGSAYASPPRAHGHRRRRSSVSLSKSASSVASTSKTITAKCDATPRETPTSPPSSPTAGTISLLEMLRHQIVVEGRAAEESVETISASPASPPGEHADPAAAKAARRALFPGYERALCLIEWYYTGHSWDDISRDTEVLQLQLSSENIISPTGAPAAKHRKVSYPKDDTTPTPSRPSSPVSSASSSASSSVAGQSGAPDLTEAGVDSGIDAGVDSAALSAALKAAIESSFGSISLPTTPKAVKEARNKDKSPVSTMKSLVVITKDKGKATITGEARITGEAHDEEKADQEESPKESKEMELAARWKWPERKSSIPKRPEDENDGFDIDFHANQLLPLPEFRRLRTLRLTGMLGSHQPDIWLACWVNPNLQVLMLDMKHRPRVYDEVGHFKPKWISGNWTRQYITSGQNNYFGDGGKGRLDKKRYGVGEYLDKLAIEQAKVRAIAMGHRRSYLSIVHLVLSGFVVDSGPFSMWFGQGLRSIHFKRDCVDVGFWLPPRLAGLCGVRHNDRNRWEILETSGHFRAGGASPEGKTPQESLLMLDTTRWFRNMSGGAFIFAGSGGREDEVVDPVSRVARPVIDNLLAWDRGDRRGRV